mmetsp:Transcript_32834/g.74116  ORF Transcript_32834/g.74116 Transcript_32834/m.74116 type:complete len:249 (-) Transcript_32834:68-814(-)
MAKSTSALREWWAYWMARPSLRTAASITSLSFVPLDPMCRHATMSWETAALAMSLSARMGLGMAWRARQLCSTAARQTSLSNLRAGPANLTQGPSADTAASTTSLFSRISSLHRSRRSGFSATVFATSMGSSAFTPALPWALAAHSARFEAEGFPALTRRGPLLPALTLASTFLGADQTCPTPPASSAARSVPRAVPLKISAALMNSHHSSSSTMPPPLSSIFAQAVLAAALSLSPDSAWKPYPPTPL